MQDRDCCTEQRTGQRVEHDVLAGCERGVDDAGAPERVECTQPVRGTDRAQLARQSGRCEHRECDMQRRARVARHVDPAQHRHARVGGSFGGGLGGERRHLGRKEQEQRQAKAADGEAKLKAMEAEQQRLRNEVQRQTKAAADAEAQRKAAEAAQQRLKEEIQRQAKAAADAEQQRKAAEAEQQRLAAVKAEEERKAKAEAEAAAQRKSEEAGQQMVAFTITNNLEAMKIPGADESWKQVPSIGECEATCMKSPICKIFTYNKGGSRLCYMYSNATFQPNEKFDSGIRSDSGITSVLPASLATQSTGLFTIRSNTEAIATSIRNGYISTARARSIPECEQKCAQSQSPACKIFTYDRSSGMCYIYSDADFRPNEKFDSGVRK